MSLVILFVHGLHHNVTQTEYLYIFNNQLKYYDANDTDIKRNVAFQPPSHSSCDLRKLFISS